MLYFIVDSIFFFFSGAALWLLLLFCFVFYCLFLIPSFFDPPHQNEKVCTIYVHLVHFFVE